MWITSHDYGPFDSYTAPVDCCGRLARLDPTARWAPYYHWSYGPIDLHTPDAPPGWGVNDVDNFDNTPFVIWLRQYLTILTPIMPTVHITLDATDAYCDKCDLDCSDEEE